MRIAFINPTNNLRRPIGEIPPQLLARGHSISIMYPYSDRCPTDNWRPFVEIRKYPAIRLIKIPSVYYSAMRYSFPQLVTLIRETRKVFQEHDVVHIWEFYYPLSVVPLIYAFLTGQRNKIILTTDGFVGYSYKPKNPWWLVPAFKFYTRMIAYWLFKIPTVFTVYGKPLLAPARKVGISAQKLRVYGTGLWVDRFVRSACDEQKILAIKEQYQRHDELLVLFSGMLTQRKGVDKVIEVCKILFEKGYEFTMLLEGEAHGENEFLQLVPSKYAQKIQFIGGHKSIKEFMHAADVFFIPSEGEGLPGVVMEAMACSMPIVSTNENCTPVLIENGKEGFLVKPGDIQGYAAALQQLLDDAKLRDRLARAARQKIESSFNWPDVVDDYEQLYTLIFEGKAQ